VLHVASEPGPDGATHAAQLSLDQVFGDPSATHRLGLHVKMVQYVPDTSVRVHQAGVGSLLRDEVSATGDGGRHHDRSHHAALVEPASRAAISASTCASISAST
jgi:hypothetical protein